MSSSNRWRIVVGFTPLLLLTTPFIVDWAVDEVRRAEQFRASTQSLEAALAETDRRDPSWRWNALQASLPDVPDSENLFLQIPKVKGLLAGLRLRPSGNGVLFDEEMPPNQLYDDDEIAELFTHQKNHAPAIAIARNLEKYPQARARFSLAGNPFNLPIRHPPDIREVTTLMAFEVEKLCIENRPGEALIFIRGMMNCSEAMSDDLFFLSHLMRNSCRNLTCRTIQRLLGLTEPGRELATLVEPLRRAATSKPLRMGFRGERAMSDLQFEYFATQPDYVRYQVADLTSGGRPSEELMSLRAYRPFFDEDRAASLRVYQRLIDSFDLPMHEQRKGVDELVQQSTRRETPMTNMMVGSTVRLIASEQRNLALLECTRVAIACELFRQRSKRWPKSLEEIPKEFLSEIPLDPYDGKPLRYRILPESIRVYTIGDDGLEDEERTEGQVHPSRNLWRIEVWNPEKRRLPGPPSEPEPLPQPMELPDPNEEKKE